MIIDMQKAIKNKTAHPADTPADVKIAIKDLNLYYGAFHALHGINLDIERGKITAFIGPSGCGKSTLLKTLNRMNDLIPECRVEGSITLDGEDIYGSMDVNLLRKRVGMVFQKPNPFPMSVYDNIAYGPRTHGIHRKAQLDEIVESSLRNAAIWDELKDRLNKSALGLSGGQQQRLCIARALAVEPEVLLMDEPTEATEMFHILKNAENPHFYGFRLHTFRTTDKVVRYGINNQFDFAEHPAVIQRGEKRTINICVAVPDVA